MSIEAMKQALEALEILARYENPETRIQVRKPKDGGPIVTMYPHKVALDAAQSLRQAIEQAEKQEPVAWVTDLEFDSETELIPARRKGQLGTNGMDIPLYAQPQREWVGLTDGERNTISRHHAYVDNIIKATEAKLKEKNT
jgi:hypothetical protein